MAHGPNIFFLPVSRIYQLWSQAQFFQCLIANHNDDGSGCWWNDAGWQSFGQSPAALFSDQLPERLNDWGPPFHLNTHDQSGNAFYEGIAFIFHFCDGRAAGLLASIFFQCNSICVAEWTTVWNQNHSIPIFPKSRFALHHNTKHMCLVFTSVTNQSFYRDKLCYFINYRTCFHNWN